MSNFFFNYCVFKRLVLPTGKGLNTKNFVYLSNSSHIHLFPLLNPSPDDKILDWSKLKAFADDKLNVTKMIISVFD